MPINVEEIDTWTSPSNPNVKKRYIIKLIAVDENNNSVELLLRGPKAFSSFLQSLDTYEQISHTDNPRTPDFTIYEDMPSLKMTILGDVKQTLKFIYDCFGISKTSYDKSLSYLKEVEDKKLSDKTTLLNISSSFFTQPKDAMKISQNIVMEQTGSSIALNS